MSHTLGVSHTTRRLFLIILNTYYSFYNKRVNEIRNLTVLIAIIFFIVGFIVASILCANSNQSTDTENKTENKKEEPIKSGPFQYIDERNKKRKSIYNLAIKTNSLELLHDEIKFLFGNDSSLINYGTAIFEQLHYNSTNKNTINYTTDKQTKKFFNGDNSSWYDDDLENWEYISDGNRLCFINYLSGLRVYANDNLFHVLKRKMLHS